MGLSPSERRWSRFRDLLPLQERNAFHAARTQAERHADILSPPLENHAVPQLVQVSPQRRMPLQDITPRKDAAASVPLVPAASVMPPNPPPNDAPEWPVTSIYFSPSASFCSTLDGGGNPAGTHAMHSIPAIVPVFSDQKILKEDIHGAEEPEEVSEVFFSPTPLPKTPSHRHMATPNSLILQSRLRAHRTSPSSPKNPEWTYETIQSCTSLSQLILLETTLSSRSDFPGLRRAVQSRMAVLRRRSTPPIAHAEDASSQSSSLVMSISTTTTTIELLEAQSSLAEPAVVHRPASPERRSMEMPKHALWRREEPKQRPYASAENKLLPHDSQQNLHRDYLATMEERIQDYMQQNLSLRQQMHATQVQLQRIQADRSLVIETLQSMLPPNADHATNDSAVDDLYQLLTEWKKQWMRQQQQMVQIQNELHQSEQSQLAAVAAKDKSEHLYIQATRDLRRLQRDQKSLLDQIQQLQQQESKKIGEYREREQQYQRIIAEMKEQLTLAAGGENRVPMNLYRAAVREAHQYRQELQSLLMMRMNHVWPTAVGPWPNVPSMARPKTPGAKKYLRTQQNDPMTEPSRWSSSPIEDDKDEFQTSPIDADQQNPAPTKSVHWNSPELAAKPKTPVSTPAANWKRYHRTATPAVKKSSEVPPTTGDTTTRTPVSLAKKKEVAPTTSDAKENQRSQLRISLVRAAGGWGGLQQTLREIRKSPHPVQKKDVPKEEQSSYQQKLDRMRIRPRPLQEIKS